MNMLVIIAIANAILWSGVILVLLLVLARNARRLDMQIDRLEQQLTEAGVEQLDEPR
ncbi:MAG TPA: hypothetical protein PK801_08855 [Aggregatilineales bacterium]|nr:hypothetical protein [Aggregatilineales bacterium]HQA68419.1 hypothetical protein [Aggregatilineales bacterium]HQE18886.1 hypothetical protein [Aggregatilineales bacterium]